MASSDFSCKKGSRRNYHSVLEVIEPEESSNIGALDQEEIKQMESLHKSNPGPKDWTGEIAALK